MKLSTTFGASNKKGSLIWPSVSKRQEAACFVNVNVGLNIHVQKLENSGREMKVDEEPRRYDTRHAVCLDELFFQFYFLLCFLRFIAY